MAIENAELVVRDRRGESPGPPAAIPAPPWAVAAAHDAHRALMDVFADFFCKSHQIELKRLLDALEKCLILKVLNSVSGNQKEAARILGIKYTTLNQKIRKHGIRFRRGIDIADS